jgi:hypothetical protein
MATSTNTRNRRTPAKKATNARKAAPKVTFPKYDFPLVESVEDLAEACESYIEWIGERKAIAQDANKAQYWAGQAQAMKNFLANGVTPLLPLDENADDGSSTEATE